MRWIILILLLTWNPLAAPGQLVKGRILDASTQDPIALAAVFFNGTFMETSSDEVEIRRRMNKKEIEANMKHFRREFLGTSFNSRSCEILNEEAILFLYNSQKDTLRAFAMEPIQIHNTALGYKDIVIQDSQGIKFLSYPGNLEIHYLTKWSRLYFNEEYVYIAKDGFFDPTAIGWEGDLGKKRLGDFLPYEYNPED